MKRQDLTDTKALDIKSLAGKAKTFNQEIAEMVLQKNMNSLKDSKSINKKRKDLAQVLTIMKQKELLALFEINEKQTEEVK